LERKFLTLTTPEYYQSYTGENARIYMNICRFKPIIDVFETRLWKIDTIRIVIIYTIYAVLGPNVDVFEI